MLDNVADTLKETIYKNAGKSSCSCKNLFKKEEENASLPSKAKDIYVACAASAASNLGHSITNLINARSKQIQIVKKEAEEKRKKSVRRARLLALGLGVCGLGAGLYGGYTLSKKCSCSGSDYCFSDPDEIGCLDSCGENALNQNNYSCNKSYTEELDGFMLSTDGTTLLMK